MGEVKFAEIRGEAGVVRFANQRDAEVAISNDTFRFIKTQKLIIFIFYRTHEWQPIRWTSCRHRLFLKKTHFTYNFLRQRQRRHIVS